MQLCCKVFIKWIFNGSLSVLQRRKTVDYIYGFFLPKIRISQNVRLFADFAKIFKKAFAFGKKWNIMVKNGTAMGF